MNSPKIVMFEWDNHKDWTNTNGNHIIIGQHLPDAQNDQSTHVEVYGISLDIADLKKEQQLKRLSCSSKFVGGEVVEITKEKARALLIEEIDKALDVLFSEDNKVLVEQKLNVPRFGINDLGMKHEL